eukprot:8175027-Pyramimonas_sp.AAC.1
MHRRGRGAHAPSAGRVDDEPGQPGPPIVVLHVGISVFFAICAASTFIERVREGHVQLLPLRWGAGGKRLVFLRDS